MGTRARRGTRAMGLVALAALTASVVLGTAGAAAAGTGPKLPPGGKVRASDPCSLVARDQVRTLFGSIVVRNESNDHSPGNDCAWILKTPGVGTGRLVGTIIYPAFTPPDVDAVDVLEDDRANAQLAGPGVVDVDLGKAAFLDKNRALLEVAANKKVAFSLQLLNEDGTPSVLTPKLRSQLTTLATDVAKRAKRASSG